MVVRWSEEVVTVHVSVLEFFFLSPGIEHGITTPMSSANAE